MERKLFCVEIPNNKKLLLFDSYEVGVINSINPNIEYVTRYYNDEYNSLIERVPTALEVFFNDNSTIYSINSIDVQNLKQISKNVYSGYVDKCDYEMIYIKNVYEKLKELKNNNYVNLYFFPSRPDVIPSDDSDLIKYSFSPKDELKKLNKIKELLLVHPELIYDVNNYLEKEKMDYFFSDSDLINNYELYLKKYCEKELSGKSNDNDRKKLDLIYFQNCNYFIYKPTIVNLIDYDYKLSIDENRCKKKLIYRVNYKNRKDDIDEI